MITLYTLPPAFGERCPSPFCLKVEMALTHLKLDFDLKTTLELNKAPKGKAPWLDDNGIIADSEIILDHLDRKTGGGLFRRGQYDRGNDGKSASNLAVDDGE